MKALFILNCILHLHLVLILITSSVSEAQLLRNQLPQAESDTLTSDHHFLESPPAEGFILSELPAIGTVENERIHEERQEVVVEKETSDQVCYPAKAYNLHGGGTQGAPHQAKPCEAMLNPPQIVTLSEADTVDKQSVEEATESSVQLQINGGKATGIQLSMLDGELLRQHRPLNENVQLAAGWQSLERGSENLTATNKKNERVTHLHRKTSKGGHSEASSSNRALNIGNAEETPPDKVLLSRRARSLLGTEKTVANYSDLTTGAGDTAYTTLRIISSFAVTGMVTISRTVTLKSDTALCGGRCTITGSVSLSAWLRGYINYLNVS